MWEGRSEGYPNCIRQSQLVQAKCAHGDPFNGKPKAAADSIARRRGILSAVAFGLPLSGVLGVYSFVATTWRELIPLPNGGLVIDTPGMREFHMWVAGEGLGEAFPDLTIIGAGCKFSDCQHSNEPGCAVKAAVEAGQITRERYASFLKLQRELAFMAEERKQHTYTVNKRDRKSTRLNSSHG